MAKVLIVDTDPGIDDAIALVCLLKSGKKPGMIVATSGNLPLEVTSRNAARIVKAMGESIPVIMGSSRPLVKPPRFSPKVHGEDGLGGVASELPDGEISERNFLLALLEVAAREEIEILTLGPLTDAALFIRAFPEASRKVKRIWSMGGTFFGRGNVSRLAEFNFWADPEAAQIVLSSGIEVRVIGLDVTRKTLMRLEDMEFMKKDELGGILFRALKCLASAYEKLGEPGFYIHDAVAVFCMLHPEKVKFIKGTATVDTSDTFSRGCALLSPGEGSVLVATDIDVGEYMRWLKASFEG